ncbi:LacI family transcriptional regulator [Opitutaceae bacterium TAV4]|nr:LacI family transcriptional regulator [Opitutaceae bacterium TAV4]RRJ99294.1 LacI family transcriptional regulator [Opitutaceae bacterium TAV3]
MISDTTDTVGPGLPVARVAAHARGKVKISPTRITMAIVAAQAGVSRMTVSRAFRNDPSIPLSTRDRIRHIAEKLGYRPDPQISQFMARVRVSHQVGAETIAWLTAHPNADGWKNNSACVAFHEGICAHAAEIGYRIEEFWLAEPGMTGRRMSDILRARGIRGVLVAPLYEIRHRLDLRWEHFAAATCGGYTLTQPHLHRACCHYLHAVRNAFGALARLGYERIGVAFSEEVSNRLADEWLAQAFLEQSRLPESRRVPPFLSANWRNCCPRFMDWYFKHRPDAILSFEHVLDWLPAHGIRIPEDCAFALIAIPMQGVAHIDEQRREVGAAALDLVIEQLNMNRFGPPPVPKIVQVECKWVDGPTAPPRHPASVARATGVGDEGKCRMSARRPS